MTITSSQTGGFTSAPFLLRRRSRFVQSALQGVDPAALEAAFRQHASSISAPIPSDGLSAIAVDGKTLRGSFDAFSDRKAAHMMSALRQADQIVLGHLMVAEKSNEIPAAPELIEGLGLKGCVFTLDAEHAQKNRSRA